MLEPLLLTNLLSDPSPAPLWKTVTDSGAQYVIAIGLGWLGSSLRLGRKIRRTAEANKQQLKDVEDTFQHAINELTTQITTKLESLGTEMGERIEESDRRINELAQEVWGVQQKNGMRGDIRKLKEDSEAQGKILVRIATQVDMILSRLPSA